MITTTRRSDEAKRTTGCHCCDVRGRDRWRSRGSPPARPTPARRSGSTRSRTASTTPSARARWRSSATPRSSSTTTTSSSWTTTSRPPPPGCCSRRSRTITDKPVTHGHQHALPLRPRPRQSDLRAETSQIIGHEFTRRDAAGGNSTGDAALPGATSTGCRARSRPEEAHRRGSRTRRARRRCRRSCRSPRTTTPRRRS